MTPRIDPAPSKQPRPPARKAYRPRLGSRIGSTSHSVHRTPPLFVWRF